ncbi:transglutaminase domain-containing protein [Marixanthomonas sp. SCSIO 43207]|uniref:transglutaminase-like domain-containing protein n=1 Tax=Marixanthomonas sp. SCSIO 43207 TaxID=2779360 RepID=UPI001CA7C385|nr:transglutaminase-like domain-containing protein [Marixanthomonas sp. SCSIO 43207]UAB80108.1 transglutaminase domain-containing protein [Marixanthomonas sp. SCSIO 43207]
MYYKSITLSILLIIAACTLSSAQKRQKSEFGNPTSDELAMQSFPQDPEASAVILYEQGTFKFEAKRNRIVLIKEVYKKIKVIDANKYEGSTIEIPLLSNSKNKEKIEKIKALTHNGSLQTYVREQDFFTINEFANFEVLRFTFPDVKNGSILEYQYKIESPFFFNLDGWQFQHTIPTLYSEFFCEIPGNFKYNRVLKGERKLHIDEASINKNCLYIDGYTPADCESTVYAMKNIPAFKQEKYMLGKSNYLSKVEYELREFFDFRGMNNEYTKTWKDVDKEFKNDKSLGRQLNNNSYFKRNLPENLLNISSNLEKAKAIYSFIQNHYKWNGKHRIFNDIDVKNAFEKKVGNTSEINLSLINALQAAGLEAYLVLLSTRENGIPTSTYPVLTDFNRAIALVSIDGERYLLDVVEEEIPFGMIPFQDLNHQGRVMDFKNGSYWYPLTPNKKNIYYVNSHLKASEDGFFTGKVNELYAGYNAVNERKRIKNINYEDYVNDKEKNPALRLSNLVIEKKDSIETSLKVNYNVTLETELIGDKIYLNPYFFETYFSENPFKAKTRSFPIDFGYPQAHTYLISIDLDNQYEVIQLPENKSISLFSDVGKCTVLYSQTNQKINIRFSFNLTEYHYPAKTYYNMKKFFETMISFQNQDPILLKKI